MKKGLSKLLSLACVFALLMTMAIPAFATATKSVFEDENAKGIVKSLKDDVNQYLVDQATNVDNGILEKAVKAVASDESVYFNDWKQESKSGPFVVDVLDAAGSTKDIYGVFVCTGSRVRLHLFDKLALKSATDAAIPATVAADLEKALVTSLKNEKYAKGWQTVVATAGNVRYYFDAQGYLAVGTAKGALLVRNVAGEYDQYLIGFNKSIDYKDMATYTDAALYDEATIPAPVLGVYNRDYALARPFLFCVYDTVLDSEGAVAKETYYRADGTAVEGLTGFNKTQPEYYQTRQTSGYIEMKAGLQEVPVQHYDAYAGAQVQNTLRVYGWPKAGAAVDRGSAQVLTGQIPGGTVGYEDFDSDYATFTYAKGYDAKGTLVDVSLSAGDDPVTYLVQNDTYVRTNDGTPAKNLISAGEGGKIYIINSDGTVYHNGDAIKGTKQADSNVYKYDGYLKDWGKVKVVTLNGVAQNFYVPAAGDGQANGTYDGFRVATDYYRYVPAADGSEAYEGITYYNSIGNSYLGWMSRTNGSFTSGRMYQTHIKESDTYIIVAGPQYLEAGVNPTDTTKTVAAGWYLFDKDGVQVQGTGSFYKFGKTFVLKNDVIQTVDGQLITFENCAVDLTK